jgi:uncharacterized protein YbjT (DUF2867 family)
MSERILVIDGTGTAGSRVARLLAGRNIPVAVGTRRPSEDHQVRFDWADPDLVAASEGIGAAYLVAPTDRTDHLSPMQPFLEQAMVLGTRRFVLRSAFQLSPGGPMMGEVHAWPAENAPNGQCCGPPGSCRTSPKVRTLGQSARNARSTARSAS